MLRVMLYDFLKTTFVYKQLFRKRLYAYSHFLNIDFSL